MNIQGTGLEWTGLTLLQEGEVHRQNNKIIKTMGGGIGRNTCTLCVLNEV